MRVWKTGGRGLNAVVVGLTAGTRRIFVTDGLLRTLPPDEVQAVFCHEETARIFAAIALWMTLIAIVYGLLTYEWAGTTMLAVAGLLAFTIAAYVGWKGPSGGTPVADEEPDHDEEEPWFPVASGWPITLALGLVLFGNGLLLGQWLVAPAIAIIAVDTVEDAIAEANGAAYGLSASVFTARIDEAFRFAAAADTGMVMVNASPLWRADLMPYGGLKGSGIGKEGPRYALEEMTELKSVVFHGIER